MAVLDRLRDFWNFNSSERNSSRKRESLGASVSPESTAGTQEARADAYEIRPLTLGQLDELWQLDKRCFVNGEAYSRETLEFLLGEPNNLSYRIILTNGAMVGFVIAMLDPDGTGHITTIGIAPEHRRRKLAFRLLDRVETAFRKRGVNLMRLEVRTINRGAQQLYERAGYVVMQRLSKYYANGGDGLLMVKSLN